MEVTLLTTVITLPFKVMFILTDCTSMVVQVLESIYLVLVSIRQTLEGNGTIGKLSINNANGVNVPVGNEFTITNSLRLQNGVLNINNNLLTLGLK
jgi:hypothetical protein